MAELVGVLHVLDEPHFFQYPKICFNQMVIKPSPTICLMDGDNQIKTSNLIAVAVPVVEGQLSNSNIFSNENAAGVVNNGAIRLESCVECINFDLSREFSRRGKRTFVFSFNNVKPILRLPSNAAPLQDVVIQLGFTVYNLDTFPPTVVNQVIVPYSIKVMPSMTGWEVFKQFNFADGQNSIFLTARHAPEKPVESETLSLPSNVNTPPIVPTIGVSSPHPVSSPSPNPTPAPPVNLPALQPVNSPSSQPSTPESNPQSPPLSPQLVSSPPQLAMLTIDIKLKNDTDAASSSLGQIQVPKGTRLDELRKLLLRDTEKFELSSTFSFYFEKMDSLVESHQEAAMKVDLFGPSVHIIMPKTHSPKIESNSLESKENITKPNAVPPQTKDTSSHSNNGGLNTSGSHSVGSKSQTPSPEEWMKLNDKARLWWLQKYNDLNASIVLDDFISDIEESFDTQSPEAEPQLIHIGLNDFFGNVCKSGYVKLSDLLLFLRFYGPIDTFKNRVYQVYKEKFFHGFISLEESETLLRGCLGAFLVRYSQSLLEKGCFVLNVNKGTKKKDVIESYIIRYDINTESFIFYNKTYKSLREFSKESLYQNVLKDGVDNNGKFGFE